MKFEGIPILKPAQRPSLAFMRQYVRVTFLEEGVTQFISIEGRAGGYQALVTSDKGVKVPVGNLSVTPEDARGSATKILSENLELFERGWAKQRQTFRKVAESIRKKKTIWAQKLKPYNREILYRIVAGGEIDKLITVAPENILEEIPAIENAKEDIYWWTVEELRAECARQGLPTEGHKKLLIELLAPGKGINPPYPTKAGQVWDPIRHIWVE
ncbi:MAG TPA: SAP domain-containing protein [Dehalococcoidia bacterium]|nr:SAP domain-containing protein [Dehalococcoidia bacterium]